MIKEISTERPGHRAGRKEEEPRVAVPSASEDSTGRVSARPPCLEVPPLHMAEYRFILRCQSGTDEVADEGPHQHSDPWRMIDRERR
jgi:hypothetical protein